MGLQGQQLPILLRYHVGHLLRNALRRGGQGELLHKEMGELLDGHALYPFGEIRRHFPAVVRHKLMVNLSPHARGIQQCAVQIENDALEGVVFHIVSFHKQQRSALLPPAVYCLF